MNNCLLINLNEPANIPKMSNEFVSNKHKAAAVCLHKSGKSSGIELKVNGSIENNITLIWDDIESFDLDSYNDQEEATEWGAESIAFIVIDHLTDYNVIKRSIKGTGVDYLLAEKNQSDLFQQQNIAKLEVSGIFFLKRVTDLQNRVKQKVKQASTIKEEIPIFVVVTAFSIPQAEVCHVK